ncbi:MAG: LLM class flavin-dependent oxidoreductase [Candidatus Helarchaeota archaeon]
MRNISFGVQHGTNTVFLRHKVEDILKSVKLIDELGYQSTFLMDHLNFFPQRSEVPGVFTLLGAIAANVRHLRVGPLVTEPHRRHPAQIALEMATLHRLTNEKAICCIGAGEGMNLLNFNVEWDKPVTRLEEAIQVIKLLWESNPKRKVNFEGSYFNLSDAYLQFPLKKPPSLWLGANSPRTIMLTAKFADGWIPTGCTPNLYKKRLEKMKEFGRLDKIEKAYEIFVAVNKSNPELARNLIRPIGAILAMKKEILEEFKVPIIDEITLEHRLQLSLEDMMKNQIRLLEISKKVPDEAIFNVTAAGNSSDIIEQLNKYVKAGVEHFVLEIFGNYWESLEVIAEEIIPYFQE